VSQTAYLFPGQGSQSVGMGQELARSFTVAHETFAEADAILGYALSELCFTGPAETLTETRNAQPAILVTSIAALRALLAARPELPPPACVAGHSLGEYSALVASGALSFADAVRLTRVRGELMAQAGAAHPGSMAAILRLTDEQVAAICAQAADEAADVVQVANYNSPGQVVISGGPAGVAAAVALAKAAGGRAIPLAVSIPAHSALMAPAAEAFAAHVATIPFTAPAIPIIGNVTAEPLTTPAQIRAELVAQLTAPVRWTASMAQLAAVGITRCVEIGPGDVLTGLVKRINPALETANVATPEDVIALTSNE
jgi:[acyl-carrier-protein] S-malonyltransferase